MCSKFKYICAFIELEKISIKVAKASGIQASASSSIKSSNLMLTNKLEEC